MVKTYGPSFGPLKKKLPVAQGLHYDFFEATEAKMAQKTAVVKEAKMAQKTAVVTKVKMAQQTVVMTEVKMV